MGKVVYYNRHGIIIYAKTPGLAYVRIRIQAADIERIDRYSCPLLKTRPTKTFHYYSYFFSFHRV